jgi:DNA-binding transcriptional regulator YiaG
MARRTFDVTDDAAPQIMRPRPGRRAAMTASGADGGSMVVRSHATTPRPPRCSSPASKYPTGGAFIAWARREHGFSQPELGAVVGRSVTSIAAYEQGLRRPPPTFPLDVLDAMPVKGISFNDVATWYRYRPVTTRDPAEYRSIHEYVAAVRVFFGYSRAGFAATLGCTVSVVRAYEHCVKPDEILLRRLVRRHTAPQVQYRDVAAAFPDPAADVRGPSAARDVQHPPQHAAGVDHAWRAS